MIRAAAIVMMAIFLFSGQPLAYADEGMREGREQLKKDREILKQDRERLKADREKMREERKAHREERRKKHEERKGNTGGGPSANVSGAPTNPGTGVHASGN